ncbi:MAG: hypothetical protein KC516_00035 [Nanoarchaeota archaeon]|nr:hypothetical protein [Nanoarchaeota archaeon]
MGFDSKFYSAVSVLVGTCIGAGVLGIPYVAAQSGFFLALVYLFFIGGIILLVNLYLGEVALRTKGDHQLIGYAKKYLGKSGKHVMEFATVFGIYAALVAYMLGIGRSISFLAFGNFSYELLFGVLFGIFMSFLIKGGLNSLKKFEKMGVIIILSLLVAILVVFVGKIQLSNLLTFNSKNILLPFGVILFALMSFQSISQVKLVLKGKEKSLKKVLFVGTLISLFFYIIFTFVVVGFKGIETPDVATLALGSVFVFLGIFTMFTSYLAGGNALVENFMFDERYGKTFSWFLASIIPIFIFVSTRFFSFFSFTEILSLGGVVSGGILGLLILFMIRKAKLIGKRKPEYSIPVKWIWILILGIVFAFGVLREILLAF